MQCAVCTVIDGMCTGVLVVAVERWTENECECGVGFLFAKPGRVRV